MRAGERENSEPGVQVRAMLVQGEQCMASQEHKSGTQQKETIKKKKERRVVVCVPYFLMNDYDNYPGRFL